VYWRTALDFRAPSFPLFPKKKFEEKMRKGWDANEIQVYILSENAGTPLASGFLLP
jgi:hypothetical protein